MYINVMTKISGNDNSLTSLIIQVKYHYNEKCGNYPVILIYGQRFGYHTPGQIYFSWG